MSDQPSIDKQRKAYRRAYEAWRYWLYDKAKIRALIYGQLPVEWDEATPEQFVEAIESIVVECDKCRGKGIYGWGGTVNGVPVHQGDCYQCRATGKIGLHDVYRCRAHRKHWMLRNAF